MEALVALGFAANVVQFADFTSRVISQSIKIYRTRARSDADVDTSTTHLDKIHRDLVNFTSFVAIDDETRITLGEKSLATKLRERGLPEESAPEGIDQTYAVRKAVKFSACDRKIFEVCLRCEDVSLNIREAIVKLEGNLSSRPTMWKSFAEALRTIWDERKFETLAQQLKSYRETMMALLLASLREKVMNQVSAQKSNHEDLYNATLLIRRKMDDLLASQEETKVEIIQAVQKDYEQQAASHLDHASQDQLQEGLTPASRTRFNKRLLDWIRFSELEWRQEQIDDAYNETFEWIYRPPPDGQWSNFTSWLEDESEPLYWITGKPAAGKSTLLKFITHDRRTTEHLARWAGDKKLLYCSFYFWNSGTSIQMSMEGMLRTILHQALSQAPELWTVLFPSKMEEFILFADPFKQPLTSSELVRTFEALLQTAGTEYRLFLFLDGLDEFGEDGGKLVTSIKRFISPDVKTCVSSRDLSVFDDGFQERPKLRLDQITQQDITHYVTSRFSASLACRERQIETPTEIKDLIDGIIIKASGVFLWVRLVTDMLLKGLETGERIEELQEELRTVPVALEDLFWKILSDVNSKHRTHMSQLLQIMRCRDELFTLLEFSYADDLNPGIVSITPYGSHEPEKLEARARTMHRRLKECCKGLLQAEQRPGQQLSSVRVKYLHRTVKDYLDRPEIWSQYLGLTDDTFNLSLRMYNMYAVGIKMMYQLGEPIESRFWFAALRAIDHAVRADPNNAAGLQVQLLKQLDEVATYTTGPILAPPAQHWSGMRKGSRRNTSFLHLAIQLQLQHYVEDTLLSMPTQSWMLTCQQQVDLTEMLLMATLYYDTYFKDTSSPHLDIIHMDMSLDLITLFLEYGADPDASLYEPLKEYGNITGSFSVWQVHLREPNRSNPDWISTSLCLLDYGADPELILNTPVVIPDKVKDRARQKAKKKHDEAKKQRLKNIASIFKVERFKIKGGRRLGRTGTAVS